MKIAKILLIAATAVFLLNSSANANVAGDWPKNSYYKKNPLFHQFPDEKGARYNISRLGPAGISIDLMQPAFTMHIAGIEEGSPAAATGQLKKGQIIESINGTILRDRDPRVILGNIITDAEANGGKLKMMVKNDPKAPAKQVIVKIPALGSYSKTWPLNCQKSERIVRNFAKFLDEDATWLDDPRDVNWGAALFMLSTGDPKDLEVVKGWFHNKIAKDRKGYPWDIGYSGLAICEYYLKTGDKSVLPGIKSMADELKRTIYNGGWAGRGGAPYRYMAGGHLNAAGVHCVTFLMLAKECGVEVDKHTFDTALKHFYRFAGHGNVAYGDGLPEGGFVDNGKTGKLAFAMAAAANLTGESENSVYARARDISAQKSFYSTSWLFHGHTGGGIGEIWRGNAMGLVKDKKPNQYRSFMNERRWLYDLSRRHDGSFGITGGHRYDVAAKGGRCWGNYFPLVYTIPRKQLRIFGAPKTKYSHEYKLPKRPWGTKADEAFLSIKPGEYKTGKYQDITKEQIPTDASWPILRKLHRKDVSDETLWMYCFHPDQGIRSASAREIKRQGRYHLIAPLLKHKDPRARHAGTEAIYGTFKSGAINRKHLSNDMVQELGKIINDPNEAWWVVQNAMMGLSLAKPEQIEPHLERLIFWLQHEEWWLRKAATIALTPISTDEKYYKKIIPLIAKMVANNERAAALKVDGIVNNLVRNAKPHVRKFALDMFGKSYIHFPKQLAAPGGQDLSEGTDMLLENIASTLANTPGGFDVLYQVSKKRFPEQGLPHAKLYMKADSSKFGPELREAFKPIIKKELIPEYLKKHGKYVSREIPAHTPGGSTEGLARLYAKAGDDSYLWKHWGPQHDKIKWQYHSFDPKDGKINDTQWRWRKVDWPNGMENWYKPDFKPKQSQWKVGYAPLIQTSEPSPQFTCERPPTSKR